MNSPDLRFLADEGCDFAVVRALRGAGYDVAAVSESRIRSDDSQVIERAYREERILLTEDKDFGWLVLVSHKDAIGVVLIRFPSNARLSLPGAMVRLAVEHNEELRGAFVVLQPNQVRFSRKPPFIT